MTRKALVIGAGFSGISAATALASRGFEVKILEKHSGPGGRARQFKDSGYTFDMGPSWYWMPDVFEKYFSWYGHAPSDFYTLKRLDPSYCIYYGKDDKIDVPAGLEALVNLFEKEDPGSGIRLRRFLKEAAYKYEVGVNKLVYKPGRSLSELLEWELISGVMKLDVFSSIARHVRKVTKNDKLVRMMEFPVLFLGALPGNTPALYSLMNYADMALGTWFPEGGMYEIVKAMVKVAQKQGVEFIYNAPADEFRFSANSIKAVRSGDRWFDADVVVSSADYHHTEQALLPAHFRNYSTSYWKKRVMAPSCLIYYVGLNAKIDGGMPHHTLFFDESLDQHATEIYTHPQWPSAPLFYVSLTTKTDPSGAPEGHENMFVLIPVASNLEDTEEIRESYFKKVLERMERLTGQELQSKIDYYRSYAYTDFVADYHSFRGNAYGLANTLMQTANLKPSCKNKKLENLYYTGQLTVPGPGVPPALISGKVVAEEVCKDFL
jgi:phytoene desaturase